MPDITLRRSVHSSISLGLILCVGCAMQTAPAMAVQSPRNPSVSERAQRAYPLYQSISRNFWNAEDQLQQRVDPFSTNPSPYTSPLSQSDPLYQKYFQVGQAAGEYIQFLDDQKQQSWTLPPVLYLGGIAAFTIGDYANAQKYFSRLLSDYPDYKRYSYIGDNYTSDPDFAQPAKPGISKVLFYCEIANRGSGVPPEKNMNINRGSGVSPEKNMNINRGSGVSPEKVLLSTGETPEPRDAFSAFQEFNTTSLKVLSTQASFAKWLANRPNRYQRREFHQDDYGDEPDQLRASVLPKTQKMISNGWQRLFPAALKKSGALAMRTYLRTLATDDSSLRDIAAPRLAEVDGLIVKSYFAQAKVLLAKKNFAATRAKYKQIITEYPGSDASHLAETQLPKVVPIAVNYYQQVADASFHPAAKIGVPQGKASTYYEKMFKEDDSGSKADVALYYWARALGTEGKVKQEVDLLQLHLKKFQKSKMRAQTMYLLGFTYCNHQLRDYKNGVPLLLQVAKDFPKVKEAPESLWTAAFVLGWQKQYAQAIPLLQQLKKNYPKSPRAKYADQWIAKYGG